jgi:hypothetical protein
MVYGGAHPGRLHRRVITFVDGTNVLMRLAEAIGASFRADNPPEEAIDLACRLVRDRLTAAFANLAASQRGYQFAGIRTLWFGSYRNNDDTRIATAFRERRIEARLFLQEGGRAKGRPDREKGVDMGVAREMLVSAFHQNMDIAILVTGDDDYAGLVGDVKRYGVEVWGASFNVGRGTRLYLACDEWFPMDGFIGEEQVLADKLAKAYPPPPPTPPPAAPSSP